MKAMIGASVLVFLTLENGILGGVALSLFVVTICLWVLNRRLDNFAAVADDQSRRISNLEDQAKAAT